MAGKQNHNRDAENNQQSYRCIRKRNQQRGLRRSQKKKRIKKEDKVEGEEKKN